MRGVPTVLITVRPEESRIMRPPRAISPRGFTLGHSLGPPHQPEIQRRVLRQALRQLEQLHMPGSVLMIDPAE